MEKSKSVKNRREAILKIIEQKEIKTEIELLNELERRNIQSSQPTLNRDLKFLAIIKDEFGIYQLNMLEKREKHKRQLKSLFNSHKTIYFPNVKTVFIKTSEATSQSIAYHLESIFSDIVLKATIDINSVTLLVDEDKFHDEEFQEILSIINQEQKKK